MDGGIDPRAAVAPDSNAAAVDDRDLGLEALDDAPMKTRQNSPAETPQPFWAWEASADADRVA